MILLQLLELLGQGLLGLMMEIQRLLGRLHILFQLSSLNAQCGTLFCQFCLLLLESSTLSLLHIQICPCLGNVLLRLPERFLQLLLLLRPLLTHLLQCSTFLLLFLAAQLGLLQLIVTGFPGTVRPNGLLLRRVAAFPQISHRNQ